jgi:uncharacterized protein (TIGR00369 family)
MSAPHRFFEVLLHFVQHFPFLGLFLLLTIEEAGVPLPLPGDVLLVFAGTHAPERSPWYSLLVVGTATAAVFVGSSLLYFLMRRGGRPLLQRVGRYLHLHSRRLERVERFFRQRGHLAIFVGRLIPGMRIPTTVLVGLVGVPYREYAVIAALTAMIWSAGYFWLGVLLGHHGRLLVARIGEIDDIPKWLLVLSTLLILGGMGASLWHLRRRGQSGRRLPDTLSLLEPVDQTDGQEVDRMDLRQLLEAEPFLGYLGLEVIEAQAGQVLLRLPLRREVSNHIGSIHGGAQYALGEATAIALAATLFPEQISLLDLLTAHADIAYQRPARGDLTARAELSAEACERLRAEFGEQGHGRFSVAVEVADAEGEVATTLTVECVVRLRG